MGRAIRWFENHVVPLFPQSPQGQLAAGALLALALPLGSFLVSLGAIALAGHFLGFWASLALETFWCWQALALRDLQVESMAVYAPLCRGALPAARRLAARQPRHDGGRRGAQDKAPARDSLPRSSHLASLPMALSGALHPPCGGT